MNEEEVRLLQAAVGSMAEGRNESVATSQPQADAEVGGLPDEALEKLLAQLQEGISPPKPVPVTFEPAACQQVYARERTERNAEPQLDPALVEQLAAALTGGDSTPSAPADLGHGSVKAEDITEEQLEELQKLLGATSHAGTSPSSVQSHESSPTPGSQDDAPSQSLQINNAPTLLQRQEQVGLLLSNEIYRQTNNSRQGLSNYQNTNHDRPPSGTVGSDGQQMLAVHDDPSKSVDRERIREENRERKKRWREVNQDRNKDNDLRCRVTKRATRLFGPQTSQSKTAWIAAEFNKRKQKREQKEKSKADSPEISGPHHPRYPTLPEAGSRDSNGGNVLSAIGSLLPGGPMSIPMDTLVDIIMKAPPDLVAELHKVATEISGTNLPPALAVARPVRQVQHQPLVQPAVAHATPGQVSGDADSTRLDAIFQGLATGGGFPEGFDLLIAELAGDSRKPKENTKEDPMQALKQEPDASRTIEIPEHAGMTDELDVENVDELLAALAAAETDSGDNGDISKPLSNSHDCLENPDAPLGTEAASTLAASISGETLEKALKECGIDLTNKDPTELTGEELAVIDEAISSAVATKADRAEPMETDTVEIDGVELSTEELDGMSQNDIDVLLGQLTRNSQTEQLEKQDPPAVSGGSAPPYAATGDSDTSAQYTSENIAAILKVIFEGIKVPTTPVLEEPPRGTKRSSPTTYAPSSAKRMRGSSPIPSPVNQLQGILQSSTHGLRPPTAPLVSPAYAASFGNSDAMNKRLIAMKPPPYRPGGGSAGNGANSAPIPLPMAIPLAPPKRKGGDDEKKIKAMGFPPLMAGIKRKVD